MKGEVVIEKGEFGGLQVCNVLLICKVMWDLYEDYRRSVVEQRSMMWEAYLLGRYVNNVKCMHTSVFGHIVDCIEFI